MADQSISSLYQPTMAEMVKIEQLTEDVRLFTIHLKNGHDLGHRAGQFVEVSVFGIGEAPISVTSSPTRNGVFELCVRRVGDVTEALHRLKPGSAVGIRGPFGNGFPVEKMRGQDVLLAPGGLGLPPLRSLINQVLDERQSFGRVIILYGARNPSELLFKDELAKWEARDDVEFHCTVDRGDGGPARHVSLRDHGAVEQGDTGRPHLSVIGTPHEVRGRQMRPLPDQQCVRLPEGAGVQLRSVEGAARGDIVCL
jgi:NAD(P)H-flavin reductase